LAILYRHIRTDKQEVFYIGIGESESRAYHKTNRTRIWKNIAAKGYEIEILFEDLTWEQAKEKEKEFIALYGRRDLRLGTLVNLTDGGEGTVGFRHTKETKDKCRLAAKNQIHTEESKRKKSLASKGELNPCFGRVGELHPLYGKPGYWKGKNRLDRAKQVIYKDIKFQSQTALAKYLNKSKAYVTKLLKKEQLN
jgi:hypothetical protein